MAAKELKALVDIGTSLGHTGEDLKQWLNDERMRIDGEKEKVEELKRRKKRSSGLLSYRSSILKQKLKGQRLKPNKDMSLNCRRWKWSMS